MFTPNLYYISLLPLLYSNSFSFSFRFFIRSDSRVKIFFFFRLYFIFIHTVPRISPWWDLHFTSSQVLKRWVPKSSTNLMHIIFVNLHLISIHFTTTRRFNNEIFRNFLTNWFERLRKHFRQKKRTLKTTYFHLLRNNYYWLIDEVTSICSWNEIYRRK